MIGLTHRLCVDYTLGFDHTEMNQAPFFMRNYIVYRHQLFKPSEGFIFDQTKYLSAHRPIFAGRSIESRHPDHLAIETLYPTHGYFNLLRHTLVRDNHLIAKACAGYQPAFIHAHFGVEGVYALPLAKQLNIPLLTTFHGFDATSSNQKLLTSKKISWLNYLIFRKKLKQDGNLFICISDYIRECLLNLGFPEDRLITHYIGIDVEKAKPLSQKKTEKIILHVARLVNHKGTDCLLQAFSLVRKRNDDSKLIIIGDGPLRQRLEKLTSSLNLENHVRFLGSQTHEQVVSWMQKSTVFCMPSSHEGLGLVFLEAAACALPTIGLQHGGIPEAVKQNETGFLIPEQNPHVLAERLGYLLDNESICEKMGLAGRRYVEEHFDLKLQTEKLEKIYMSLG